MNPTLGAAFNIIGLLVGVAVYLWEAKRRQLNLTVMTEVMLIGITCGIIAATLVERIVEHVDFAEFVSYTAGGRTIIGGVLGGWIAIEIYKRRTRVKQNTGPLWALVMPAGEFFGRIGCWFNGCCYGRVTAVPWALRQHDALRHPTQFYMAFAALIIFVIVWRMRDKPYVFWLYLTLWAGSRFVIEQFREPVSTYVWLTQAVCAVVFCFALAKLISLSKPPVNPLSPLNPDPPSLSSQR